MDESAFNPLTECSSIVDLLRRRTNDESNRRIYTFLMDEGKHEIHLTYRELDQQARAIGALLQKYAAAGERVLLLYSPGLKYIAAFFGCLYAGVIAIPAYPPRRNRSDSRLQAIVADADATIVLTDTTIYSDMEKRIAFLPELKALRWLNTDELPKDIDEEWHEPIITERTISFLQYTSGSTTTPRGVMVSHRNLLQNLQLIHEATGTSPRSVGVNWLPFFHDMGLITGVLQPIYDDFPIFFLSPFEFLQHPILWLQTMSNTKASHSGGPNFAYELCIKKIQSEQCQNLDLSNWMVAFNGSEPVRLDTLDRFATAFKLFGFRREAFLPCYGLAEATVGVSWAAKSTLPHVCTLKKKALGENKIITTSIDDVDAQTLVSCGKAPKGQKIIIVNPESMTQCTSMRIGEIWVSGPSVAQGYWNRTKDTALTFEAHLTDTGDGPFLRTGDLGFLKKNELFVTGRLRDLIIIRGQNHFPQDIEHTVELSHPILCQEGSAAFSIDVAGEERLVIVQELERHYQGFDTDEIINSIRQAVAEQHDLQTYSISLIRFGDIPKTSSGKVQRYVCRERYLAKSLKPVAEWVENPNFHEQTPLDPLILDIQKGTEKKLQAQSVDTIQAWLINRISKRLNNVPESIDIQKPFAYYGLDSITIVSISAELEGWLGSTLSPTMLYEYPTIESLAQYLGNRINVHEKTPDVSNLELVKTDPIAIVGIGCRFPGGANGPEAYWQLLRDGKDAITEVPAERWDWLAYYDPNPGVLGKTNSRWGGFLGKIDQFDSRFFGISPREAARMDPQQRLLLEVTWEALEDAGQVPERLAGTRTGVFIGISTNDYSQIQFSDPALIDAYAGTGNALSIASNRISYIFDFRGPSISIDTACSSSLVAVYQACHSLWRGESSLALAGGVNLILSPAINISFTKAGVMSPDGRCKAFDAGANGYVRGEGAGIVVLKPFSKALLDGDSIYAVIRGGAINQDGRTNGLMAPSPQAQEAVLREAYSNAGVFPSQVHYIEAHGTGTLLGDPIEAKAIGNVVAIDRPFGNPLAIGSVKTNIGHLEAAAGIAGLIKVALSLKYRMIPPSLHFKTPNPYIPFDELHMQVQQSLAEYPQNIGPAFAGVSSFGFGGTNVHLVLEGASQVITAHRGDQGVDENQTYLLPLSGHTPEVLGSLVQSYQNFLRTEKSDGITLKEICYTASVRRSHHNHRIAFVGNSTKDIIESLGSYLNEKKYLDLSFSHKITDPLPKLIFVFPGQGSQWIGMGQELLRKEPIFRKTLEHCEHIMDQYASWSLIDVLTNIENQHLLSQVDIVQPVLFAIQVGLANLWRSWGVEPNAVVGHSMGEIAAAHIAGALNLEDAIRIICFRSQLLKRISGKGCMAVVELPLKQAENALSSYENQLSIAASNSPTSTVISGDPKVLEQFVDNLQRQDIFCRFVKVDVASHSPQVDCLTSDLLQALDEVLPQRAAVPIYSTVTGDISDGMNLTGKYWARNMREPVLFSAAIHKLLENGHTIFVEISPHPILLSAIQQVIKHFNRNGTVLPSLRRDESEQAVLLSSLGTLYTMGCSIDWERVYPHGNQTIHLPFYPLQREHCWLEIKEEDKEYVGNKKKWRSGRDNQHPLLGRRIESAHKSGDNLWEIKLNKDSLYYLNDHLIAGAATLPAAVYLEMALAAAKILETGTCTLSEVRFHKALFFSDDSVRIIQMNVSPDESGNLAFHVYSHPEEEKQASSFWTLHASGKIHTANHGIQDQANNPIVFDDIQSRCREKISLQDYYSKLEEMGLQYGPSFRCIENLWRCDGEAFGQLRISPAIESEIEFYNFHPVILSACLQILAAAMPKGLDNGYTDLYLPIFMEQIRIYKRPCNNLWSHACLHPTEQDGPDIIKGSIQLYDESGCKLVEITGLHLQRLNRSQNMNSENISDWLYNLEWQIKERTRKNIPESTKSKRQGIWLVFGDGTGIGQMLANNIVAQGGKCVLVFPGAAFKCVNDHCFQIRPERPEDLQKLLEVKLQSDNSTLRGVIHLWSLDSPASVNTNVTSLKTSQILGCTSAMYLIQELIHIEQPDPPLLWLVTQGAQSIDGDIAPLSVAQTPLWGLGRTISQEHHNFWGGLVDLDPNALIKDASALLWSELEGFDGEDQVAFRKGQRYVARLVQRKQLVKSFSPLRCKSNGTYLITGGLGDLGLQVARWLVLQGARRLILLGHTKLPPRTKWNLVENKRQKHQIATIREMEALGASIHIAIVDVANETQLTSFLTQFRNEGWPPICGVVHAAGLVQFQPLQRLDANALNKILRPKLIGSWLLHKLLIDTPLDFFVLFSSISTLWSSPLLGSYSAANAFLDGLAHHRRALGLPALSINWGPWREIGMVARYQRVKQRRSFIMRGMGSIGADEGLEILGQLLQQNPIQVAVMPFNWEEWCRFHPDGSKIPLLANLISTETGVILESNGQRRKNALTRNMLISAGPSERQELLEVFLCEKVAKTLGIPTSMIDLQQPLSNLGLDSLMGIELKNQIELNLKLDVPLVTFLRAPSISQLASRLLEQLMGQISHVQTDRTERHNDFATNKIAPIDAENLLAKLDKLSDEDVDSLLRGMAADDEDIDK